MTVNIQKLIEMCNTQIKVGNYKQARLLKKSITFNVIKHFDDTDLKLLFFWSEYNGSCEAVKIRLDNLGVNYSNIDIDTDEGIRLSHFFSIQTTPTILIIRQDQSICAAWIGTMPCLKELQSTIGQITP